VQPPGVKVQFHVMPGIGYLPHKISHGRAAKVASLQCFYEKGCLDVCFREAAQQEPESFFAVTDCTSDSLGANRLISVRLSQCAADTEFRIDRYANFGSRHSRYRQIWHVGGVTLARRR